MMRAGADPCPEEEILRGYRDRSLSAERWLQVDRHVEGCETCRQRLRIQGDLEVFAMSGATRREMPARLWGPLDRFMEGPVDEQAIEGRLSVIDSRTGRSYEIPIRDGAIRAFDLRQIKASDEDFGLLSYDPAFLNTASCRSTVTYIDGDRGILRYRGYPIDELAEHSRFLDVAHLVLRGELPDKAESQAWDEEITHHTFVHENVKKFIDGFHHDAHPMGILVSTVAALSTFYPEAKTIFDAEMRKRQVVRLIAKMPTLAAFAYRHAQGLPYAYPDNDLSYTGNFLNMMWKTTELKYRPDPAIERALDVLFILHADHEQNCSANTMRAVGSAHADPYSAMAAATAALYGPLHGGANEEVLRMLWKIGTKENIPEQIDRVKAGEFRLPGFGHRVYKNFDPRAQIIKKVAEEVFDVTGPSPLLDIALELERIALQDEYFIDHKLYPNVDFYSGIIYLAMGFPVEMFPVLFAIGRTPGWLAQWEEGLLDPEQKISRPRQMYVGQGERHLEH
jgi:citrate synthase